MTTCSRDWMNQGKNSVSKSSESVLESSESLISFVHIIFFSQVSFLRAHVVVKHCRVIQE